MRLELANLYVVAQHQSSSITEVFTDQEEAQKHADACNEANAAAVDAKVAEYTAAAKAKGGVYTDEVWQRENMRFKVFNALNNYEDQYS